MLPSGSPSKTFKSRFCEHFGCPPSEYEEQVVRCVLYRRARLLGPLLGAIFPNYFVDDFQFVASMGHATSLIEVHAEIAYHKRMFELRGLLFLRRDLKLRVSGEKALSLARRLFSASPGRVSMTR